MLGKEILATSDRDGLSHQLLVMTNASSSIELPKSTSDKLRLAFSL